MPSGTIQKEPEKVPDCVKCGSKNVIRYGKPEGKQKFRCKDCGREWVPILCPRCGSSHIWKNGSNRGIPKYQCAKCRRQFQLEFTRKPKEPKKVVCPKCGSFRAWKKGHSEFGKQRYKCKNCGKRFQTEYEVKDYKPRIYVHREPKPQQPKHVILNKLCGEFKDISVRSHCQIKIFQLAQKSNPHVKTSYERNENIFNFEDMESRTEFLEKVKAIVENLRLIYVEAKPQPKPQKFNELYTQANQVRNLRNEERELLEKLREHAND